MKTFYIFLLICITYPAMAIIKLPAVVSDHMMIQRDTPAKLWGWADKGETVSVIFNGQTVKATAGKDGVWRAQLKPMLFGGPYEMTIKGKTNAITLKNILIGDIWVCSGQSNMEWPVINAVNGREETAGAQYSRIRLLTINKIMSEKPLPDANTSGWVECNPQNIPYFTAVGYFFGRELYQTLDIPIGLINVSWGGSNVETWTSIPTMRTHKEYTGKLDELQSPVFAKRMGNQERPDFQQMSDTETGTVQKWYLESTNTTQWEKVNLPARWSAQNIKGLGVAWYSRKFTLTGGQAKGTVTISLGGIDDWDETYLNGRKIGATRVFTAGRQYTVCPDGLKEGENILTVKMVNIDGDAGLYGGADQMYCQTVDVRIPLSGEWRYRVTTLIDLPGGNLTPNDYPSLLFNAMITPIAPFPVKGVVWYQGENNTHESYKYRFLFPNMMSDWRKAWGQENLPFYFVQLANFMAPATQPGESNWAELRESQHLSLRIPYTGEAVAIDIGEAWDIHPRNKQEVGHRLALNALAKTYGKNIEYSGPEYHSMKTEGNRIILTFGHIGDGLVARGKYGYLQGFSIAGNDQKFVWAKAVIEGNTVIVHSEQVEHPVAVRYAWANNPDDANLYNSLGLPASPFRTDTWKLSSQN